MSAASLINAIAEGTLRLVKGDKSKNESKGFLTYEYYGRKNAAPTRPDMVSSDRDDRSTRDA